MIPWTVACQAPLSMGFSKQEYCPPGDLPNPGTEPKSPASLALAGGFFAAVLLGKPTLVGLLVVNFYVQPLISSA